MWKECKPLSVFGSYCFCALGSLESLCKETSHTTVKSTWRDKVEAPMESEGLETTQTIMPMCQDSS